MAGAIALPLFRRQSFINVGIILLSHTVFAIRARPIVVSMSVFTALCFAFLLCFSPLVRASALPCPECEEEMPPPVIVTKTEPCDECEEHNQQQQTPTPVIITEQCDECEHNHLQTPHPVSAVFTSTISTCGRPTRSVIPYTSGSSTFYVSSCIPSTLWHTAMPSTMWYTQNGTCGPQSTVFENITTVSTSISTATIYQNGTAPPAITITGSGQVSTLTVTSFPPQTGPVQFQTLVSTLVSTQSITYTSYASGSPPATVTLVSTQEVTTTSFESGSGETLGSTHLSRHLLILL